jgi:DNA-binding PadR family transcriptional regulator
MKRERRSSQQTLAILNELMSQPRAWRHGYDLSLETELKSGTLYPVLMRLSERGVLDSKWEQSEVPGRPPRRMYRLTPKGIAYAKSELALAEEMEPVGKPARGRA